MQEYIYLGDDGVWPRPALEGDEQYGLGHRLRYGNATKADLMAAARFIDAYGHIVCEMTPKHRDRVIGKIRNILKSED